MRLPSMTTEKPQASRCLPSYVQVRFRTSPRLIRWNLLSRTSSAWSGHLLERFGHHRQQPIEMSDGFVGGGLERLDAGHRVVIAGQDVKILEPSKPEVQVLESVL